MEDSQKSREQLIQEIAELRKELKILRSIVKANRPPAGDSEKEIAERNLMEDRLRESEEKYRFLVESTDNSIYLVDKECRYLFLNKKHLSRLGLKMEEIIGRPYDDFHSQEETAEFVQHVNYVISTGGSTQYVHKSSRDDGYFLRTLSPVRNCRGEIQSVTVISKNITHLKEMEERLYALSLSDELTGVCNRRGFLTLADQQIKIAKRMQRAMLLIYVDLDNLKWINDTCGHAEGDAALKNLAAILKSSFRESDIIARIGGDEFVVLITEVNGIGDKIFVDRLQANIDEFNRHSNKSYLLSFSTGSVLFDPFDPLTVEQLIVKADQSMYGQKAARQKEGS